MVRFRKQRVDDEVKAALPCTTVTFFVSVYRACRGSASVNLEWQTSCPAPFRFTHAKMSSADRLLGIFGSATTLNPASEAKAKVA